MAAGSPGARGVGEVQLSVVVPVYGCADCLVALHAAAHSDARADDRQLRARVRRRPKRRHRLGGAAAARRAGPPRQRVSAQPQLRPGRRDHRGLAQARGDWAVVMDCDLQEAPEDIPRLWAAAQDGLRHRAHDAPRMAPLRFRRWTSRALQAADARDRRPARLQQPQPAVAARRRRVPAAARPRPRVHDRARLARV